jgi:hypothetical protein
VPHLIVADIIHAPAEGFGSVIELCLNIAGNVHSNTQFKFASNMPCSLCIGTACGQIKVTAYATRHDIGAIPEFAGDPLQFFVGG